MKLIETPTAIACASQSDRPVVGNPLEQIDRALIEVLNCISEAERQGVSLPGFADNVRYLREQNQTAYQNSVLLSDITVSKPAEVKPPEPAPKPVIVDKPMAFRVYQNQDSENPWSVDTGHGTHEYKTTAIHMSGVFAETKIHPGAAPSLWMEIKDAYMTEGVSAIIIEHAKQRKAAA